jgi:hypothetical protein
VTDVGVAGKKTFVFLAKIIVDRHSIVLILDFSDLSAEAGVALDVRSVSIEEHSVTLLGGAQLFPDSSSE